MKVLIGLEDGTVVAGRSFTGAGEAIGEIDEKICGGIDVLNV